MIAQQAFTLQQKTPTNYRLPEFGAKITLISQDASSICKMARSSWQSDNLQLYHAHFFI